MDWKGKEREKSGKKLKGRIGNWKGKEGKES